VIVFVVDGSALSIHGDVGQAAREDALYRFKAGRLSILVCVSVRCAFIRSFVRSFSQFSFNSMLSVMW
jgi:hypothetical protein